MTRYKGIIFDLDGTLLDTIQDLSDSVNYALSSYKYKLHTYEEYKLKIGKGFRDLIKKSLPDGVEDSVIENALELFLNKYSEIYMSKTKPYPGITNLLQRLSETNIKMAVNSNKRDDYTKNLVEKNFKEIPFVKVIGERNGVCKKPDPKSALEIAAEMEFEPKEIIYVGDSKTDIMTAKNAGMSSMGVLWGFRSRDEFLSHDSKYIVKNPEEIYDIVMSEI